MVKLDPRLLEALQASTCFGIAHDDTVPECKQCDVKAQCAKKSEGADIPVPVARPKAEKTATVEKPATKTKAPKTTEKPKANSKPKATANKTVTKTETPGNMPEFKPMSLDELKDLAKERSVEWKDYGNDQITRMRLIMALKKSY